MNDNDLSWKIARVAIPIAVYCLVSLVVQAGVYTFFLGKDVIGTSTGSVADGYGFLDDMSAVASKYALLCTLISALIMIPVLLYMMYKDDLHKQIKPVNFKGYWIIAGLGVFGALGVSRFILLFPLDNILGSYSDAAGNILNAPIALQIFAVVFTVPVMEEMLFRGVVYNRIKGYNDKMVAAVISAIIFGVYHMNLAQGLYAFILGIILAAVYEQYKSILAPMFLHIVANFAVFISGHNKVSSFIDSHFWVRLPVALAEVGIFAVFTAIFISNIGKDREDKKEQNKEHKLDKEL